jgi:hypothetical protein
MIVVENVIGGYEREVVNWVKKHCQELGYEQVIQENKDKTPDLIMLRNGKEVKVEVETYSSSFIKHGHKLEDVDEVLCVVKDKELPLKTVKIKQLMLWHDLNGDDLVDFFKLKPNQILVNNKTGEVIHHLQEDWANLSEKHEEEIRVHLRKQAKTLLKTRFS